MSFLRRKIANAAVGVGIADDPAGLRVIRKPGCAAAIWRRQLPQDIKAWLDQLDPTFLPRGRAVLPVSTLSASVGDIFDIAGTPTGPERDWLKSDISELAALFSDLMDVAYLRVRLDVIHTNACRKFHIDAIKARLICTYRGTGTQYGISTDGNDPERVFTAQTGAPIVLRGTLWPEDGPDDSASGLLHRSPPIEGSGETRLVLVLDPMLEMEDDT